MAQIKQALPTHTCTVTNKFHNTPVHKSVRMSVDGGEGSQGHTRRQKMTEEVMRAINQKARRIRMIRRDQSDPAALVL